MSKKTPWTILSKKEAENRFNVKEIMRGGYGEIIRLYEGDTVIDGDFPLLDYDYIVNGNLTVNGNIVNKDSDYGPFLFVLGNVKAKNLIAGGSIIFIKKNLVVKKTIFGFYNHGRLEIKGNTIAKLIISNEHHVLFHGGSRADITYGSGSGWKKGNPMYQDEDTIEIFVDQIVEPEYGLMLNDSKVISYIEKEKNLLKKNKGLSKLGKEILERRKEL